MMVLKPDQERVKALLRDTITLLCKNGLDFKSKFSIDAVIGVTLDEEDVFLVSVNEIVKSDAYVSPTVSDHGSDTEALKGPSRKRKKKKHRDHGDMNFKVEEPVDDTDHEVRDQETSGEVFARLGKSSYDEYDEPEVDKSEVEAKMEHSMESPASEDIIIIKEELHDTSAVFGEYLSTDKTQEASFTSLPEMNLSAVNSSNPGMSNWIPNPQASTSQFRTGLMAEGATFPQGDAQQMEQQMLGNFCCSICQRVFVDERSLLNHENMHRNKYKFHCSLCNKGYVSKTDLEGHMAAHTGTKQHACDICGRKYSHKKSLKDHLVLGHHQRR